MDYKIFEDGRIENTGAVKYNIEGVLTGDNDVVESWLQENMKPNDTCQWFYVGNNKSPKYTYEKKMLQWRQWDVLDREN